MADKCVDDSVVDLQGEAHRRPFKQLASWGGFRRHFKEEEALPADAEAASAEAATGPQADVMQQLQRNLDETRALEHRLAQLQMERGQLEQALSGSGRP